MARGKLITHSKQQALTNACAEASGHITSELRPILLMLWSIFSWMHLTSGPQLSALVRVPLYRPCNRVGPISIQARIWNCHGNTGGNDIRANIFRNNTDSSSLMKWEEEKDRNRRRDVSVRGRGEDQCVWVGGGGYCINIACAEPAEDAYPSVGAAVTYQWCSQSLKPGPWQARNLYWPCPVR